MLPALFLLLAPAHADCVPPDLAATDQQARQLLNDAETEKALALVLAAEQNLGCLDKLASIDTLAALYWTGGTAALAAGNTDEAHRQFANAARMAGELVFDPSLGANAMKAYQDQLDLVATSATVTVVAWEPTRLDGRDLILGQSNVVHIGPHLFQEIAADGSVQSATKTLAEGQPDTEGTPPVAQVPAVVPPQPARKKHLGLVISATTLIVGGSAAVIYGGVLKNALGDQTSDDAPHPLIDALTLGGAGAIGLGTGTLFCTSLLSSDSTLVFPVLSGRW